MINIRTIENVNLYALGTWTSQTLENALASFPTGTTTEWGALAWDESNTGTGYTGLARIDILNSSGTVLISDIAKNSDGSVTDLSGTVAATSDIKIRVKLYAIDSPTPIVSNLRIKYKNWGNEQVVTLIGKNVALNRFVNSVPTISPIRKMEVGNGQTTLLTESMTALDNAITSPTLIYSSTVTAAISSIEIEKDIDCTDPSISDGTIMNATGYRTSDSIGAYLCAATRFSDITKESAPVDFNYVFKGTFKIVKGSATSNIFTKNGRNVLLDRVFISSPTYNPVDKYVIGLNAALSDTMTGLDTTVTGPSSFVSTNITLDTASATASLRIELDKNTGNGNTYDAFGHLANTTFLFGAEFDTILKSSSYHYIFTSDYVPTIPSALVI